MAALNLSVADIQTALQTLLPRGKVWNRDQDATQSQFWASIAPTFKRECDAAAFLLVDAFPATTNNLLPEWEETLGLPDPCAGGAQTVAQRVAQVVAKLSQPGGQSIQYFVGLANLLGYPAATVTQYAPFRMGRSSMGDPLGGPEWFFVWVLNAPDVPVTYFRMGEGRMGDGLYTLGGAELRCTIERYAPAHTNVLFSGFA